MLAHIIGFKLANSKHRLLVHHLILVSLFALLYYTITNIQKNEPHIEKHNEKHNKNNEKYNEINKPLTLLESIYFSLVTQTTVGYGDIIPKSTFMKLANMLQLLTIYGVLLIEL